MYAGRDGKTHYRKEKFEITSGGIETSLVKMNAAVTPTFEGPGPTRYFQGTADVTILADPPRARPNQFHWNDRMALAYIVQGEWEFGLTDGTTMHLSAGDFYWVADNVPKAGGHTQRVVGPQWGVEIAMFLDHAAGPM